MQKRRLSKFYVILSSFFLCMCMMMPIFALADESGYSNGDLMQEIYNFEAAVLNSLNSGSGDSASKSDVSSVKDYISEVKNSMADETQKGVEGFFNSQSTENKGTTSGEVITFADSMLNTVNEYWKNIAFAMQNTGSTNTWGFSLNVESYKDSPAYGIFTTLGYSLVLLFFSATLIENSIKYEIFTLRGGAIIFGRLLISKAIIDLSGRICISILNICSKTTSDIVALGTEQFSIEKPDIGSMIVKSNTWIIGEVVDAFVSLLMVIPVVLITIPILIAAAMVIVKLILRSIELSLLLIVSPAFFACYSSEVSKPYFRSFIITFIQVSIQLVFMAVVYFIGSSFLSAMNTSGIYTTFLSTWEWFQHFLPNALIIIAMSILMVRPPKVLTGLISG